jgi:conjugative transposon TraN protein
MMQINFIVWLALLLFSSSVSGNVLPVIDLPGNVSLHFISPEPIQYVDISVKSISGDLPIKNILRIKRVADSVASDRPDAIVTIAGESFIAQYRVRFVALVPGKEYPAQIEILPEHMKPLETGVTFSKVQLERLATILLFKKDKKPVVRTKAFGISGKVSHLATFGDYIFLNLNYQNATNLKYDTDEIRFKIEDQKINKATTVQSIEIKPEFVLFQSPAFKRNFRNIYVFKKFSFPGHKILKIELNEKQISGRVIIMKLKYRDLLEADSI